MDAWRALKCRETALEKDCEELAGFRQSGENIEAVEEHVELSPFAVNHLPNRCSAEMESLFEWMRKLRC
jgi:hypothetical protein